MERDLTSFLDNFKVETGDTKLVRLVLDTVNSGIFILDKDARIVFLNSKARSMFLLGKRLVGKEFSTLFLPEDTPLLPRNIIELARRHGEFETEVMLNKGDNKGFMALVSAATWNLDGNGAFVVTVNDISRLKGIEHLLKKSEKMVYLGQMLDDISHQIRNPVLAIGGFSRRLMKTRLEKPEYVRVILEEARRLEMLLDELTEFLRLPRAHFTVTGADQVSRSVSALASRIGAATSFPLSVVSPGRQARDRMVVTDTALLQKAVEPVVINAFEACQEAEGKAKVRVGIFLKEHERDGIEIVVEDEGIGIRPPLVHRIFHPFFTTKTGHLGMGLTFARRIMDELEGSISVESTLGKGTRVVLAIPGDRRRPIRTSVL